MTIGVTAKLTVQEGKNAELETVFKTLAEAVKANEPGCQLYDLHKSRSNGQLYIVLEQYTDDTALAEHAKTAHYLAAGKELANLLAAAPEIELMDAV